MLMPDINLYFMGRMEWLNIGHNQKSINCFLTFPTTSWGVTFKTLKWTVLVKGRHSPIKTISPSLTEKAGETWAGMFLCLFSYLLYLGT